MQEQIYYITIIIYILRIIVQEEKGGYRHPKREFMTVRDFDQLGGADFKNRCYTGQYRGL